MIQWGDGYKYTSALWKYLKDEWADKKGGELPNQNNLSIGDRDYVLSLYNSSS